jgi:glyceraldehyde 3-phosphate dehydrogenase
MSGTRIGLMGFGRIGRECFRLALDDERFEVVAIADIGRPDILHQLLNHPARPDSGIRLAGRHLISNKGRARMLTADRPDEVPWDAFGVDVVVEATGRYRSRAELAQHLANGAPRVVLSTLPGDEVDRVVLYGVNERAASAADRIVSAGSASTVAAALVLKTISDSYGIEYATMTSVHAYTSDQTLQDHAGPDYRRSRAGANNILPNEAPAVAWLARLLPGLEGRLSGYALNVPVPMGSLLDVTVSLTRDGVSVAEVNDLFRTAARQQPAVIDTVEDPIVSSDVRGCTQSLLFDIMGTMRLGRGMLKMLGWHDALGHARAILDVAGHYATLQSTGAPS